MSGNNMPSSNIIVISKDVYDEVIRLEKEKRKKQILSMPQSSLEKRHVENAKIYPSRGDMLELLPKSSVCAELGVNEGGFSRQILDSVLPKKLHLIDSWDSERYKNAYNTVLNAFDKELQSEKIEINRGYSTEVLKVFPDRYFDWVYIDTTHSYEQTKAELEICRVKVREGGIIAGHNYSMGNWIGQVKYGVVEAVHEFCLKYDWKFIGISMEIGYASFALQKIDYQTFNPKISIIVPVYNAEKYVNKCLNSIRCQTLKNLEIIVINDGSTDNSGEICDKIAIEDSRVKILHKENGGLSSARNAGIELATGEYVGFVDSDDWVEPQMYEYLLNNAINNKAEISIVGYFLDDVITGKTTPFEKEMPLRILNREEAIRELIEDHLIKNYACNKLYKLSLFDNLRYPDGKNYEDIITTYRTFEKASRVVHHNKHLYHYIQRLDSITYTRKLKDRVDMCQNFQERFKDLQNRYPHLVDSMLKGYAVHGIKNLLRAIENAEVETVIAFEGIINETIVPFIQEHEVKIIKFLPKADKDNFFCFVSAGVTGYKRESVSGIFVSVIMPVYNQEEYLSTSLQSVLSQSLNEIEIICVNDGSTDSSLSVLESYAKNEKRIKVFTQENKGAGYARNVGIQKAKGEFLAFLDADDWYPNSNVLEKLYNVAKNNHVDICGGSLYRVRDNVNVLDENFIFQEDGRVKYSDYQADWFYQRFIYNARLIRNNNVLFPHYKRYQDVPFFVKAMVCASEFYAIKDFTYCQRETIGVTLRSLEQTIEMLYGIIDVLKLSNCNNLGKLFQRTVTRISNDKSIVYYCKNSNDEILLSTLSLANSVINASLLQSDKNYVLPCLSVLECNQIVNQLNKNNNANIEELQNELQVLKQSKSFRIGQMIVFIPSKMIRFVRCCKDHGIPYTLRYAIKKLVSKLTR